MNNRNEQNFFNNLCPGSIGWSLTSDGNSYQENADIRAMDTFVYLVDTATAWCAASAMKCDGIDARIKDAFSQIESIIGSGFDVQSLASTMIRDCGGRNEPPTSNDATITMSVAMAALTKTKTYSMVKDKLNTIAGHWILLCYRGRTASETLLRPTFYQVETPGFIAHDKQIETVHSVVRADHKNTAGNVYKLLGEMGGAQLDPSFS